MPRGNAKLHLVHGKGGQVFKIIDLTFANSAHFLVDHTQGPQSETLTGDQRDAGIDAQTELTGNDGLTSTHGYIWDRSGISKRSDERSVGKECGRTCIFWLSTYHKKKKN